MAMQNICDNEIFFDGYSGIRENAINANNLFKTPALPTMMPDRKGKRVLNLGAVFESAASSLWITEQKVVGTDILSKMLEIAQQENCDAKIVYVPMPWKILLR